MPTISFNLVKNMLNDNLRFIFVSSFIAFPLLVGSALAMISVERQGTTCQLTPSWSLNQPHA